MPPPTETDQTATVVITHRIRRGCEVDYERWLAEIVPASKASRGHLNVTIIRPVAGATETYTAILRFDTHDNLLAWMHSAERGALVDKARPLLAEDDRFVVQSGLDFWFTPEGSGAKVPKRWKQSLITWSAIYPLVLATPLALKPLLTLAGVGHVQWLDALIGTGVIVVLMVYLVMPRYTKLVSGWLFK